MINFQRGELIVASKPFVYTLNHNERGLRCDFCFKCSSEDSELVLRKCSLCQLVYFCDVNCQRAAWRLFHKSECMTFSSIPPENSPTETFIFFTRLVTKSLNEVEKSKSEDVLDAHRSFSDLTTHLEEVLNDPKRQEQLFFLERFLKGFFPDLQCEKQNLMLIFGKMLVNTYTICNAEEQAIGTGLYLGASIFNHSCDPNSIPTFEGTTLNIRAIKRISCNSPADIYISYIDPLDSINTRRTTLKEQYYFTCNCSSCLNMEMDSLKVQVLNEQEAVDILINISDFLKVNVTKRMQMDSEEKEIVLKKCKFFLEQQIGVLGSGNVVRIRLLEFAFDLCIDLAMWEDALTFGLLNVDFYKQYYNCCYPTVGIHMFKIGKIQYFLGQVAEAEKNFVGAKDILAVCRGDGDDIVEDVNRLLFQCRMEKNAGPSPSILSIQE